MKKIIVGFSKHPGSFLSWLIRAITKSKVSHVYSRVNTGSMELIYQASGLTVNYTAIPVFLEKNVVIEEYEIEVSDEQFDAAKKIRQSQVGKPYSVIQLIGFAWVLGCRKFGKTVKNPFGNGPHAYVCCEIIADSIGLANGESMTPEDFRRWCAENGTRLC